MTWGLPNHRRRTVIRYLRKLPFKGLSSWAFYSIYKTTQIFIFTWQLFYPWFYLWFGLASFSQTNKLLKGARRTQRGIYPRFCWVSIKERSLIRVMTWCFLFRVELIDNSAKESIVLWKRLCAFNGSSRLILACSLKISFSFTCVDIFKVFSVGKFSVVVKVDCSLLQRRDIGYVSDVAGQYMMMREWGDRSDWRSWT